MTEDAQSNDAIDPVTLTGRHSGVYQGTKQLKAWPMTRGEYNRYRGWEVPGDESENDKGYLVEYLDGGKPNDSRHSGYISWSPADVFERTYYQIGGGVQSTLGITGNAAAQYRVADAPGKEEQDKYLKMEARRTGVHVASSVFHGTGDPNGEFFAFAMSVANYMSGDEQF